MYLDLTDTKAVEVVTARDPLYGQTHLVRLSDEAGNAIWLTPREANALAAMLSDAADNAPTVLDLKTGTLR